MENGLASRVFRSDVRRKLAVAVAVFLVAVPIASALTAHGVSADLVLLFVVATGVVLPPLILRIAQDFKLGTSRTFFKPVVDAATVGAILIVVSYVVLGGPTDFHRTAAGEIRTVQLPDGSAMQLAPMTELRVDFARGQRNVLLTAGEVYLEVAHDATRPFQVRSSGKVVRALGTRFNVRHRPDAEIEVLVNQGRVAIFDERESTSRPVPRDAVQLGAEHAIRFRKGSIGAVRELSSAEIKRKLAWRSRMLQYEGEPFSQVVEDVNRFSPTRKLVVDDPLLADVAFGGRLEATDLDAVIGLLSQLGVGQRTVLRGGVEEIHVSGGYWANERRLDLPPH